jgi:hypothetical protein
VTYFNPLAWTRRQQALVDRADAWLESARSDAHLLTAEQLTEIDTWLTESYPGVDQNVLQYLARSRDKLKKGGTS